MIKQLTTLILILSLVEISNAQYKTATVKESRKVFTTYDFSDPNPVAQMGKFYPYYRFDGYTNTPIQKEWKIVELENDFIKLMVLPEIGGKIWAAWEKSTGKPFIYYNQVVKFRDVAMRGPWTSGGIEANYGIIGHTPNCATPMDYMTETKEDGSVSCYIGTLDLLTRTYWTIEINLPKDKAYFTTRSFWSNSTSMEQPYYTWMNVGMPSKGNLEFIYPGTHYLGHGGDFSDWEINPDNGKDISFYENNDFGGPKSYHIIGKYSDFFGAYYHDEDFGMVRYSLRDEKPGRKIWIWGLSRQGMIWEKLLTDNDGQYVEVQSGRLFNQADVGSNTTPFKQLGFAPHTTDEWTEYWFPVKGTKGFVKANEYGALNLRTDKSTVHIDFLPLQDLNEDIKVYAGNELVYTKSAALKTLVPFSDSFTFNGNTEDLTVTVGESRMQYRSDPNEGTLSRPLKSPEDFDWSSAFGQHILGKELIQQRMYIPAAEKLKASLEKDPHYLPALADMSMLAYLNMNYEESLGYAAHALSIDTYDPAANFYYGLANTKLGKIADAKDGFDIASLSPSFRGAAYTELSKIYFQEKDYKKATHYARKSLDLNAGNTTALQILAVTGRIENTESESKEALQKLHDLSPLNHFIRFERYRWQNSDANKTKFVEAIQNEMPHESFLQLADFYLSLGLTEEALTVLTLSKENPEVYYRMAYLKDQINPGSGKELIEKADQTSPLLVFPFRETTAEALEWVISQSQDWKPKYFLALIHWSRNHTDKAQELFAKCGEPDFAPFYAARAELNKNEDYSNDLKRAAQLNPNEWRYGKMLTEHYVDEKKYEEALSVASDYHRRFPNDFRINMLLAKTLLLNKQYKATTDLLNKTTILPYEGATDGRQLYREAWLMQAVGQIKDKNYKTAMASINKAKLWPENLGAGKPYDDMLDLRLENYLEALVYERTKQKDKAISKLSRIASDGISERRQVTDLIKALALRKTNRGAEGEKLLNEWVAEQPENKIAKWALGAYNGETLETDIEGNGNFRVIREVVESKL